MITIKILLLCLVVEFFILFLLHLFMNHKHILHMDELRSRLNARVLRQEYLDDKFTDLEEARRSFLSIRNTDTKYLIAQVYYMSKQGEPSSKIYTHISEWKSYQIKNKPKGDLDGRNYPTSS